MLDCFLHELCITRIPPTKKKLLCYKSLIFRGFIAHSCNLVFMTLLLLLKFVFAVITQFHGFYVDVTSLRLLWGALFRHHFIVSERRVMSNVRSNCWPMCRSLEGGKAHKHSISTSICMSLTIVTSGSALLTVEATISASTVTLTCYSVSCLFV